MRKDFLGGVLGIRDHFSDSSFVEIKVGIAAHESRIVCSQGKEQNKRMSANQVPSEIMQPDYAVDGIPKARSPMLPWVIEVKKPADIEAMKAAGRVAR